MPGATSEDRSEEGSTEYPEFGDSIDLTTFEQILELDEDDDEREFSKGIVYGFFQQADATFEKMDANLESRDLRELSSLGHFLKGSSASLGLTKLKDSCEKIQHFGAHKDETGTIEEPDDDACLNRIKKTIPQAKAEFQEAERKLRNFYHDPE